MSAGRIIAGLDAARREVIRREAGVEPPDSRFDLALDVIADLQDTLEGEQCPHDWADARNSVVLGGEVCVRCGAIRAGNTGTVTLRTVLVSDDIALD